MKLKKINTQFILCNSLSVDREWGSILWRRMPLNETTQVQYVQVAIHGKSAYIIKIPSSCYFKYTIEK